MSSRADYKAFVTSNALVPATKVPSVAPMHLSVAWESIVRAESCYHILGILACVEEMKKDPKGKDGPKIKFVVSSKPATTGAKEIKVESASDFKDLPGFNPALAPNPGAYVSPICELAVALSVQKLKPSHLTAWAQSHSFPTDIADFIVTASATIERMIPAQYAFSFAERTSWLTYRLTEQSTSTLCNAAVESLGAAVKYVFDDNEQASIIHSSPFDLQSGIPNQAIAKAYVVLEASGFEFGNWYQGRKAASTWSASRAAQLRSVVVESIKRKIPSAELEATEGADDVLAIAGITGEAARRRVEIQKKMQKAATVDAAIKYLKKKNIEPPPITPEMSHEEFERSIKAILSLELSFRALESTEGVKAMMKEFGLKDSDEDGSGEEVPSGSYPSVPRATLSSASKKY